MDQNIDIHKAAGILIKDRKLLVVRQRDRDFFISPGGKMDGNETAEQALIRELREELGLELKPIDFDKFGTFSAEAAGISGKIVEMQVFIVKGWESQQMKINPDDKVSEHRWIDSKSAKEIKLGSIFEHEVIPKLLEMGLID